MGSGPLRLAAPAVPPASHAAEQRQKRWRQAIGMLPPVYDEGETDGLAKGRCSPAWAAAIRSRSRTCARASGSWTSGPAAVARRAHRGRVHGRIGHLHQCGCSRHALRCYPRRETPALAITSARRFLAEFTATGLLVAVVGSRIAGGSRRRLSEDGGPVVLHADDRPAALLGAFQRLLGTARVVELAPAVVVADEQAKGRLALMVGELEHRDVAVRIARGEERPAAGPAPDPDRFLRAIVEIVAFGLVRDRAATVVAGVLERCRAPDNPVTRNPVHLLADRPHEVTAAARGDVVREPVRLQVAEQLDHRHISALEITATKSRMLRSAQESGGLRLESLEADPRVGGKNASKKRPDVSIVAGVVLGEDRPEPAIVALIRRLPGLTATKLGIGLRHFEQSAENEVSLDRHRLLAPQSSVVVEYGYSLLGRHTVGHRTLDELHDRPPRGAVIPAGQHPRHASSLVGRRFSNITTAT